MGAKSEDEAEVRYYSTYLTPRRFSEKSLYKKSLWGYNPLVVEKQKAGLGFVEISLSATMG